MVRVRVKAWSTSKSKGYGKGYKGLELKCGVWGMGLRVGKKGEQVKRAAVFCVQCKTLLNLGFFS